MIIMYMLLVILQGECGDDDCSDSYKRYGNIVIPFNEITLDTTKDDIITNDRLD